MSYDIKKPNIWFLTTVSEKNEVGVPRLRLCEGQYVPTGTGDDFEPAVDSWNVQADTESRKNNAIGTIFYSKQVVKRQKGTTNFYAAEKITVLDTAMKAFPEIKKAWEEYQANAVAHSSASATPKASGPTLVERLLKDSPVPTVENDNFYVDRDVWVSILLNMHKGYNTMLTGDSGTGKTQLVTLLAQRMKKNLQIFDMAAKQDPIASLIGVHRFDEKSVFDRADFTFAVESPDIVLLDEISRAPMNTNNILFPVLDWRRTLHMDIAIAGAREIKVHEECRFIATANEGYEYTGTNVMDRALKERFQVIKIDYMPEEMEINLLVKRNKIGKREAAIIVKCARDIRAQAKDSNITSSVSIRHTLYAADLHSAGLDVSKAMELAFLPMFGIDDEITKVKGILSAR
jgi:nitric oxide reductase NorQ protein